MSGVVVTGVGACSPLGGSAGSSWESLLKGSSGLALIDESYRISFSLPLVALGNVDADGIALDRSERARLDRTTQFALAATRQAWSQSLPDTVAPERLGVVVGTAFGGLTTTLGAAEKFYLGQRPHRVSPHSIPTLMPNSVAAALSLEFGAKGVARTISSACASGTEAIADGLQLISSGACDVVLVCSADAAIHPATIAGFASLRALAVDAKDPRFGSRPFALDRSGFVLGEGSGALVLESADFARARNAMVLADLLGAGLSSDSHHLVAPAADGDGAYRAMSQALESSGIDAADVSHINAHATGTPLGDFAEYLAMQRLFGDRLKYIPLSATKASTGHLLGGTGVIEAIFAINALVDGIIPPTIVAEEQIDPCFELDISSAPRIPSTQLRFAMSNSFGFGGHNASVLFGLSA